MRYIIYGAGGIGGVAGSRLFMAGSDTLLICRGEHLQAIQQRGLLLKDSEGEHRLPIPAVSHPREISFTDQDVVILTMKSQDTEEALWDLEQAAGTRIPVVCCQNGVANERTAARRFERVYAMLVAMPANFLEAGIVIGAGAPRPGVLNAGCYPNGVDDVITQVTGDLTRAGFVSQPDPTVMRFKYAKLVRNLNNALQALCTVDGRSESGRSFMKQVQREAYDCFAAAGIDCTPEDEYRATVSSNYAVRTSPPNADAGRSSTWQSLIKGRTRIETDYLNGEIVLLGKLHGVPTPYNALLRRLSSHHAAVGGKPGAYTLAELEAMLGQETAAAGGAHASAG
jgi:2-dehydropantoate 2-reductase